MLRQLTRDEAIAFHQSGKWQEMTPAERGIFQIHQEALCMPFAEFVDGISTALGRTIWDFELFKPENILKELEGSSSQIDVQNTLSKVQKYSGPDSK